MITYDIIFVPLEVCFTLEETNFLAFLETCLQQVHSAWVSYTYDLYYSQYQFMFRWGIAGSPSLLQSMIGLASSVRCWQNCKPLGTLAKQKLPRKDLANLMQEVLQETRSMTLPFPELAKHRRLRSPMKSDEVWCSVMNTQMTKDWFTRLFWTFDMVASCLRICFLRWRLWYD